MQCSRTRRKVCPDHPRDCQNQRPGHGSAKWLRAVSNLRHPGAFVIDDLYPTASSGNLEVAVKESDGEIRRFTQPYASVTSMRAKAA